MTHLRSRRAFALLAVLSVIVGAAALGAGLLLVTRDALASAQNRIALSRAVWIAEGCLERARAAIDEALEKEPASNAAWQELDSVVHHSPLIGRCELTLEPTGLTLNVNADESGEELRTAMLVAGIPAARADSLVDAVLDWRDSDDDSRASGAERSWYTERRRPAPRNGPFASISELKLVRGFESPVGIESLFGVDSDRVLLDRAPLAVIAALPGMTPEALARIAERRGQGMPIGVLGSFVASLPQTARASLFAHYQALVGRTTDTPDAWLVTAQASASTAPVTASVELRVVRAGMRAAVVRRRSWP